MKAIAPLITLSAMAVHADLYVTNFQSLDASGAQGVWRNHTTSTDLALPVSLTQSGGTVKPADGSSTSSILESEGAAPLDNPTWQDVPSLFGLNAGINCFEPNFIGDYINIETAENSTSTVTIDFGASVTDPILYFTDIEYRTTLTFSAPFTVLAGTSNLEVSGNSVTSDRTTAAGDIPASNPFGASPLFGEEAGGSLQFNGTFQSLTITVQVADGDASVQTEDRTGYCVATTTEPQPATQPLPPLLSISRTGDQVTLTWPIGGFDEIQWAPSASGLSGWTAIPGLDPSATDMWTADISTLGDRRFFRGSYTP